MSYILFASSGGGLATPVSIVNGGTGSDNASGAMVNLSSPNFDASSKSVDWGLIPITPPLVPADPVENERAINEIITTLQTLRVVV